MPHCLSKLMAQNTNEFLIRMLSTVSNVAVGRFEQSQSKTEFLTLNIRVTRAHF